MDRTSARLIFAFIALFCLFLAAPGFAAAQDWLPIPPEDLALKDNPKQPGTDAMILYRSVIDDASKATSNGDKLEEYRRIKIFTQKGTEYGHVVVEYNRARQEVNYITGRTIKPDGTIVKFDGQVQETTVVKANGAKVLAKSFTLPDVQPGSIVEYKYAEQGQPGWVHSHEWTVSQPTYTREANFTYVPNTSYGVNLHPMCTTYLLPPDVKPKEQANGAYVMVERDIPGIVEEPLMPPENIIHSHVDFYYRDDGAPEENGPSQRYWDYYSKKWATEMERFIDKKNALNQEVSKIVSSSDAPDVKLRKIYARVQQIRNLNTEERKTEKEAKAENLKTNNNVEDVLNHGYGYSTEINYLFVGLVRAAGLEATETWIAPRYQAVFQAPRNEASSLSDEIVWVRAGSQEFYLDPAAHFFPFGVLPWYETATGGIRVDKKGSTIADVPLPPSTDAKLVRTADLALKPDGSVTGALQVNFMGQRAALIREEERVSDEAGRTKYFEDQIKRWLPAGAEFKVTKLSNWEDNTQPVAVDGSLSIPSYSNKTAGRMLMPLEIFKSDESKNFAAAKRVNPIYFTYPYQEDDDIKLHLPAGMKLESAPKDVIKKLGAVNYQISAAAQGDAVEVKRHLDQQGLAFAPEDYPALRNFFGAVATGDDSQMVLQNVEPGKSN